MGAVEQDGVPKLPIGRILLALALVPALDVTFVVTGLLSLGLAAGLLVVLWRSDLVSADSGQVAVHLWSTAWMMAWVGLGGSIVAFIALVRGMMATMSASCRTVPGVLLTRRNDPDLENVIGDVCVGLGSPPPDAVLLSAWPEFSARQGEVTALNGDAEGRILTIGLPLMRALTVDEVRAVIAHEMAHFTGRDTLYSAYVLPVYVRIETALEDLEEWERTDEDPDEDNLLGCLLETAFKIPLLLPNGILRTYRFIFALLDSSVRRRREERADALAVGLAGRDCFASALRKAVRISAYFDKYVKCDARRLPSGDAGPINYFAEFSHRQEEEHELVDWLERGEMARTAGLFDHHLPLSDRLAMLPATHREPEDSRLARELLSLADDYEARLAPVVQRAIPLYRPPVGPESREQESPDGVGAPQSPILGPTALGRAILRRDADPAALHDGPERLPPEPIWPDGRPEEPEPKSGDGP